MHVVNQCLVVLPLPRHAESAAADLAASSLGLGIPVLPIETARTYAPGISMGTVAVFPAFSTPSPAAAFVALGMPLRLCDSTSLPGNIFQQVYRGIFSNKFTYIPLAGRKSVIIASPVS